MKNRHANLALSRTLDPERDYLRIYRTMLLYEFPWDVKLGLNLAFNRSFSIPSIAAALVRTGELTERTRKRIDDTGILMYEVILNGFDHPTGRAALRRINRIHRGRGFPNDEYLYILAGLMVIPIRWVHRYGWRRPCCHERRASHALYRELGRRMNITDIPESYEATEAWLDRYDAAHLRPNDAAAAIERATRMLLLGKLPRPLAPLGDALVAALYDDRLREAMQVPRASWPVRAGLHLGLRTRALGLRWLAGPRTVTPFADGIRTETYPDGYDIDRLGPATASPAKNCQTPEASSGP
jgi:hypothetical protein